MDILESEGVVGSVYASLEVFTGPDEEEESNSGEFTDGSFPWGDALGGGVQGLYAIDWERMYSCWSRIFLLIGLQLASQTKVEFPMQLWWGLSPLAPHE